MLRKLRLTLDMIKVEHSIFALPFAATGALLAVRESSFAVEGLPAKLWWILLCMVSARSAAMAFNRLLDQEIDGRNPRTAMRHLPAGLLGREFAIVFTVASAAIFALSAAQLGVLCAILSPVALGIVFGYSYTKRFTSMSHLVLGFALGIAPAAAWIAIRGSLDARIVWLTVAVMLWTAGFDVIYSCQDIDFDRRAGLSSIPARLGAAQALTVARLLHIGMIGALISLSTAFWLGWLSWAGIAVVAALLIYEHSLVKANDLSRVNAAFFTVNGYIGILFFAFWAADMLWAGR